MDCLKAQTRITAYVDGELSGNELKEFLLHVKGCENCREELDIYYTLIEATRQLDEGLITTNNFTKELEEKISREINEIYHAEDRKARIQFFLTVAFLCTFVFAVIKIMDIPIPIINPPAISWEAQRQHIMEYMTPYIYQPPFR